MPVINRQISASSLLTRAILMLLTTFIPPTLGTELPQVQVTNVRRVFHNGEHNAFTDLVRFKNRFYLNFFNLWAHASSSKLLHHSRLSQNPSQGKKLLQR